MSKHRTEEGDEVEVFEGEPDYEHAQAKADGTQDDLEDSDA